MLAVAVLNSHLSILVAVPPQRSLSSPRSFSEEIISCLQYLIPLNTISVTRRVHKNHFGIMGVALLWLFVKHVIVMNSPWIYT